MEYHVLTYEIYRRDRILILTWKLSSLVPGGSLKISDEFLRGAIDGIREMQKSSKQELAPQIENASKALREAQKEQEKAYRLLLSDKLDARNSEFVNQRLLKLNKEVSDLTARVSYLKTQRDRATVDHGPRIEAEFRKFSRLSELFKTDSRDKSGIILGLKTYVESVSVTRDGEYCISLYHNLLPGSSVQKMAAPQGRVGSHSRFSLKNRHFSGLFFLFWSQIPQL